MLIYQKRIVMIALLGLLISVPGLRAAVLAPVAGPVAPDDFTGLGITAAATAPLVSPVVAIGAFTGTITSQVFVDGITGGLDFYYQFTSITGPDNVSRISLSSFTGVDGLFADIFGAGVGVDVGTRNDPLFSPFMAAFLAGTKDASTVDRGSSGKVVGFNFSPGIGFPGTTTEMLVVRTFATGFGIGNAAIQNGSNTNAAVWAPTPEPRFVGLLMIGALGAFVVARRRKLVA